MFEGCKLSLDSIKNILSTITNDGKRHVISIGYDRSISKEDIEKLEQEFKELNWRVEFRPSYY